VVLSPLPAAKELAGSILELSGILGVDRNRLSALRAHPDAPEARDDGKYDVEEWREFWTGFVLSADVDAHDEEMQRLKRENLRLTNANKRFELLKKQGGLMTMDEHLVEVREILEQVKWLTGTIPTRAALLTTDAGVRDSIRNLCLHLEGEFRRRLEAMTAKAEEAEKQAAEIGKDGADEQKAEET